MDQQAAAQPALFLSRFEFIALCAALMALNALAIDIMLPGLPDIGAGLGISDENHRQFVVTAYIAGFGLGQLAFGPLSDRFGRRPPLLFGLVVYVVTAFAATVAPTFTILLVLRFVQGLGAAATRVIAVSVVRDRFGGRQMAEVMSLVFMVFMVIPVFAPGIGQLVLLFANWHFIFVFMGLIATAISLWAWARLPETLHPEYRRPFTLTSVLQGFGIVLSNRTALWYTLAVMVIFGALFGFINSAQQIYVDVYGVGAYFPLYFAAIAGMMAVSSFVNSRLVMRYGMRRLSHFALCGFFLISLGWLVSALGGHLPLAVFVGFFAAAMFLFGWIGANFNALAMEPLGHVAGTASSVLGFMQTLGGGLIGATIGQAFDGSTLPLAAGFTTVALLSLGMVLVAEKGRLFQPHQAPSRQG